jgi:ribonuclease-3
LLPTFNDPDLLNRALTHSSFANEHQESGADGLEDNERLEFLGDAVLDFVTGAWLFNRFPHLDEGRLTSVRAALVRVSTLADFARSIGLPEALRLGKGEVDTGGRDRANILGDAFEALIGALYLDQGIDAAHAFIEPFLERATPAIVDARSDRDAKSRLQEWSQSVLGVTPRYRMVGTTGPDHAKVFTVQVWFGNRMAATGTGTSKQAAEQNAAREALAHPLEPIEGNQTPPLPPPLPPHTTGDQRQII